MTKLRDAILVALAGILIGGMLIYGICKEADRQAGLSYDKELGRMAYTEEGV